MAKAEGIPPTASVVVPGRSLNYLGDTWAYAYSGEVSCSFNSETTLLEFTTGEGLCVARFDYGINDVAMDVGTHAFYRIYFNDVIVMYRRDEMSGGVGVKPATMLATTMHLIIPPFTKTKITGFQSDGTAHDMFGILTGRVYDV
jgi:hypothetical protein